MSSRVDCFCLGCIANCAGVGLDTGVLTGRRGRDLALVPDVTLGRGHFLRFDNRSADLSLIHIFYKWTHGTRTTADLDSLSSDRAGERIADDCRFDRGAAAEMECSSEYSGRGRITGSIGTCLLYTSRCV